MAADDHRNRANSCGYYANLSQFGTVPKYPRMVHKNIPCRFSWHGVSIMGVGVYKAVFGILGVKARVVGSITIFHHAEFCRCG